MWSTFRASACPLRSICDKDGPGFRDKQPARGRESLQMCDNRAAMDAHPSGKLMHEVDKLWRLKVLWEVHHAEHVSVVLEG